MPVYDRTGKLLTPTTITVDPIANQRDRLNGGYLCEQIGDCVNIKSKAKLMEVGPNEEMQRSSASRRPIKGSERDVFLYASNYISQHIPLHALAPRDAISDNEEIHIDKTARLKRLEGGSDIQLKPSQECRCPEQRQQKTHSISCCKAKTSKPKKIKEREKTPERVSRSKDKKKQSPKSKSNISLKEVNEQPPPVQTTTVAKKIKPKPEKPEQSHPCCSVKCFGGKVGHDKDQRNTKKREKSPRNTQCTPFKCCKKEYPSEKEQRNAQKFEKSSSMFQCCAVSEHTTVSEVSKQSKMSPTPRSSEVSQSTPVAKRTPTQKTKTQCCGSRQVPCKEEAKHYRAQRNIKCCPFQCVATNPSEIYQPIAIACERSTNTSLENISSAKPQPMQIKSTGSSEKVKATKPSKIPTRKSLKPSRKAEKSVQARRVQSDEIIPQCLCICSSKSSTERDHSSAKPLGKAHQLSSSNMAIEQFNMATCCNRLTELCMPRAILSNSSMNSIHRNARDNPRSNCTVLKEMENQIKMLQNEVITVKRELMPYKNKSRYSKLSKKIQELDKLVNDMRRNCRNDDRSNVSIAPSTKRSSSAHSTHSESISYRETNSSEKSIKAVNSKELYNSASSMSTIRPSGSSKSTDIQPHTHTPQATTAADVSSSATTQFPVANDSSVCLFCDEKKTKTLNTNLIEEIRQIIGNHDPHTIVLTVLLKDNNLYHINVTATPSGKTLGCIYATEICMKEAKEKRAFQEFLTFFIVDARNTSEEKNKILSHTFEYLKF